MIAKDNTAQDDTYIKAIVQMLHCKQALALAWKSVDKTGKLEKTCTAAPGRSPTRCPVKSAAPIATAPPRRPKLAPTFSLTVGRFAEPRHYSETRSI
jgi:hypothetical protein